MIDSKIGSQIKTIALAAVAISSLSIVASPVRADEALIQETVQESYTTGEGNVSVQSSSQQNRQIRNSRGYRYDRNDNNVGIVQRSQQLCDQYGEANACVQDSRQSNTTRHNRRRY